MGIVMSIKEIKVELDILQQTLLLLTSLNKKQKFTN